MTDGLRVAPGSAPGIAAFVDALEEIDPQLPDPEPGSEGLVVE